MDKIKATAFEYFINSVVDVCFKNIYNGDLDATQYNNILGEIKIDNMMEILFCLCLMSVDIDDIDQRRHQTLFSIFDVWKPYSNGMVEEDVMENIYKLPNHTYDTGHKILKLNTDIEICVPQDIQLMVDNCMGSLNKELNIKKYFKELSRITKKLSIYEKYKYNDLNIVNMYDLRQSKKELISLL